MSEKLQGAIAARQHTVLVAIQAGEIEKRGRRDARFMFGVGCSRPGGLAASSERRTACIRRSSSSAFAAMFAKCKRHGSGSGPAIANAKRSTSLPTASVHGSLAASPCCHALRLARALPMAVRGPVLRRALRRFAAIRCGDAIETPQGLGRCQRHQRGVAFPHEIVPREIGLRCASCAASSIARPVLRHSRR